MIESFFLAGATSIASSISIAVSSPASGADAVVSSVLADSTIANANDLVRGAIGGAFIIGVSFLAGFAVFRRSSAALCALLMVLAAAALEFSWLGLFNPPSAKVLVFLQALFGASVLIYVSATVDVVKRNPFVGALIFAGALSMIGMGGINFLGRTDLSGLVRTGMISVSVFTALLAALQSLRRDHGARLLLPGAAILAAAPLTGPLFSATLVSLTPHALFTFGVLAASLVVLTEGGFQAAAVSPLSSSAVDGDAAPVATMEDKLLVSENQLAEVLDYAGIAVMDWNEQTVHHTPSFSQIFNAEEGGRLSPTRLRDLIHPSDQSRFKHDVFGRHHGDGSFDDVFRLSDGARVRVRGARAVSQSGDLERLVVFAEVAPDETPKLWDAADAGSVAAAGAASIPAVVAATRSKQMPESFSSPRASENAAGDHGVEDSDAHPKSRLFGPGQLEPRRQSEDERSRNSSDLDQRFEGDGEGAAGAPLAAAFLKPVEPDIRKALEQGHLKAAFQPIVALSNRKIRGYEALLRATGGEASRAINDLPIEEIVRLADRQSQGGALAQMMLEASAEHLSRLMKELRRKDLFVAFNVTYAQLRESGFVEAVAAQVKKNKLPSKGLVLELSESEAITDEKSAKKLFAKVKSTGAGLAFDDFGAGFTSLSNLHKFTFDYLKVDKSFVEKIPSDKDASKIVASMAKLGKDLGLTVIAEGVASEALADAALSSGCTLGQGYALGEPASPEGDVMDTSDRARGRTAKPRQEDQSLKGASAPAEPPVTSAPVERHGSAEHHDNDAAQPPSRQFWNRDLR